MSDCRPRPSARRAHRHHVSTVYLSTFHLRAVNRHLTADGATSRRPQKAESISVIIILNVGRLIMEAAALNKTLGEMC